MQVKGVNSLCCVVIARAVWFWSILEVRSGLGPRFACLCFEEMPYMIFAVCCDESLEVLEWHLSIPEEALRALHQGPQPCLVPRCQRQAFMNTGLQDLEVGGRTGAKEVSRRLGQGGQEPQTG